LKNMVGSLAGDAGVVVGAVKIPVQAAQFAKDLLDPLYGPLHGGRSPLLSYAQSADDEVRQVWAAAHHPIRSIEAGASRANVALNPYATPMAPTVTDEVRRRFNIGQNQGQLAFNIAIGALAPEVLAKPFVPVDQVAQRMAQGMSESAARYLAELYTGMGHHYYPRRGVAGVKLPKALSDSPLNVLKPPGISRGDMHQLHYEVDPSFHGARLKASIGQHWSGKTLGLKKNHPVVQVVRGAPTALKQTVSGIVGGGVGAADAARQRRQP
jgi:hypothetical protein